MTSLAETTAAVERRRGALAVWTEALAWIHHEPLVSHFAVTMDPGFNMKVQASLSALTAVFAFDPDPQKDPRRALSVLLLGRALPRADLTAKDRFADAAVRAAGEAGVTLGKRSAKAGLRLVSVDDAPTRSRSVAAIYYLTAPYDPEIGPGQWTAVSRTAKLDAADTAALKLAAEKVRDDSRNLAGAAALLGAAFTGDDLLRLHIALHGGPEGSERTFRRRVQELRDLGVLRAIKESEIDDLRDRVERFRSPAGTGGRPPELLRYSGIGGETEQLAALRSRRN